MKILVTGIAGFIGYHLSDKLLQAGHQVVGIDNINNYYSQMLKIDRLKQLGLEVKNTDDVHIGKVSSTLHARLSFYRMDISDKGKLKTLFEDESFDIVVNLAAQAGVRYSLQNPAAYVESNVVGLHNLFELSHTTKVQHVIYASSSSIYGFNDKIPFSETDRVDYPVSMYAATKKSGELMAHVYSHLYKMPTTGLRFFTVYGPWGRPDMAPFLFTKAITEGKTIKVFNHGDLFRDFTYIDDIVAGIIGVISSPPSLLNDTDTPYSIYNIGNNRPVNLMDFIRITEKHVGKEAVKEYLPMQPGDVYRTYADISKLQQKTGYSPTVELDEGMGKFVEWYKEYYKS